MKSVFIILLISSFSSFTFCQNFDIGFNVLPNSSNHFSTLKSGKELFLSTPKPQNVIAKQSSSSVRIDSIISYGQFNDKIKREFEYNTENLATNIYLYLFSRNKPQLRWHARNNYFGKKLIFSKDDICDGDSCDNFLRTRYYYHSDNLQEELIEFYINENWRKDYKVLYTYLQDNNVATLVNLWEGNEWKNYRRYTRDFNSKDLKEYELFEEFRGDEWQTLFFWEYYYNNNSTVDTVISYEATTNSLREYTKTIYDYSEDGKQIFVLTKIKNNQNSEWIDYNRFTQLYNEDGNLVSVFSENWTGYTWVEAPRAFVFTYPGGYSEGIVASEITVYYSSNTTKIREEERLSKNVQLEQNYPNPFNSSTTIKFSLVKTAYITLFVYNSLGQQVMTLFEGEKPQGTYEYTFDGGDLSSGVYFYVLQSDASTNTNKMILLQ